MNCQWQSLLCEVEPGLLNMFGEEEEEERSPQYTVQLRGCEVRDGPDTDHSYRITLSMFGDQVAVLEVRWRVAKQEMICSDLAVVSHDHLSFRSEAPTKRSDG